MMSRSTLEGQKEVPGTGNGIYKGREAKGSMGFWVTGGMESKISLGVRKEMMLGKQLLVMSLEHCSPESRFYPIGNGYPMKPLLHFRRLTWQPCRDITCNLEKSQRILTHLTPVTGWPIYIRWFACGIILIYLTENLNVNDDHRISEKTARGGSVLPRVCYTRYLLCGVLLGVK